MLQEMDMLSRKAGKRRFQFYTKFEAWNSLRKFFHEDRAPEGLTFTKFLQTLQGMTDKKYGRGESEKGGLPTRPSWWPACTSWIRITTTWSACSAASSTTRRPTA